MRSISVVIPNYNGQHLFEKYLPHNLSILFSLKNEVEVIVVDDASTDGSVAFLEKQYPGEITVLRKPFNSGFSATCNLGIQHAKNDLVFLLNTDVKLEPDYFEKLYSYFDLDDTFGVTGRIVGMDDNRVQEAAKLPKFRGWKIKCTDYSLFSRSAGLVPTMYLSGAIALMDTRKLKSIDGFNEVFSPYYGEDMELSLRAWRLGWKCYYEQDAICRHEVSASTKTHNTKKAIKEIYFRNRYYIHHLHLVGTDLVLWHIQVILSDVLSSIFTLNFYKASAYWNLLKNRDVLENNRNAFNRKMKIHHSEISTTEVISSIGTILKAKQLA